MAVNNSEKPFIISDMGDNPTAGGAGDVTWTLDKILKRTEFKSIKTHTNNKNKQRWKTYSPFTGSKSNLFCL